MTSKPGMSRTTAMSCRMGFLAASKNACTFLADTGAWPKSCSHTLQSYKIAKKKLVYQLHRKVWNSTLLKWSLPHSLGPLTRRRRRGRSWPQGAPGGRRHSEGGGTRWWTRGGRHGLRPHVYRRQCGKHCRSHRRTIAHGGVSALQHTCKTNNAQPKATINIKDVHEIFIEIDGQKL